MLHSFRPVYKFMHKRGLRTAA